VRATLLIPERDEFDRARALELLLTGLVALNVAIMERYDLPPLYESGVRYREDRRMWRHALAVLEAGRVDCKSLAAYRAAELIRKGADARVVVNRTGRKTLHARVLVDGRIEDPSRRLGMKPKRRRRKLA
jgi:hypothetical protein